MLQTHSPTVMLANAIGQSDIPVGNATYLAFLVSITIPGLISIPYQKARGISDTHLCVSLQNQVLIIRSIKNYPLQHFPTGISQDL